MIAERRLRLRLFQRQRVNPGKLRAYAHPNIVTRYEDEENCRWREQMREAMQRNPDG